MFVKDVKASDTYFPKTTPGFVQPLNTELLTVNMQVKVLYSKRTSLAQLTATETELIQEYCQNTAANYLKERLGKFLHVLSKDFQEVGIKLNESYAIVYFIVKVTTQPQKDELPTIQT